MEPEIPLRGRFGQYGAVLTHSEPGSLEPLRKRGTWFIKSHWLPAAVALLSNYIPHTVFTQLSKFLIGLASLSP